VWLPNFLFPHASSFAVAAAFADSLRFLLPPGLSPNPSPRRERLVNNLTNCSQRLNTFAACLTFRPVAVINDGTVALDDMSHELGAIVTATKHTMVWFSEVPILPKQPPLHTCRTSELECATLHAFDVFVQRCQVPSSIQHNIRIANVKGRKYKSYLCGIKQNK
jgi:hypothetical protein